MGRQTWNYSSKDTLSHVGRPALISFRYVGLVYIMQTAYFLLCFALTETQCNFSNFTISEFPSEYRTTRKTARNKNNLQFDTVWKP